MSSEPTTVTSIALSGGGHRASAWGIGVLQALLDAGLGPTVSSLTSVSGGSVTNAVVAKNVDLTLVDRGDFDDAMTRLQEVIETDGLFFPGPLTNKYVRVTLSLLVATLCVGVGAFAAAVGAPTPLCWLTVALLPIGVLFKVRKKLKDVPETRPISKSAMQWIIAAVGTAITLVSVLGAWSTSNSTTWFTVIIVGVWCAATLLFGWWTIVRFSKRGAVVARALDTEFFCGASLDSIKRPVNHIFATTDLETADSLYLAPRFLASYRRGVAPAGGISLATAAQASAALPGGFPPTILKPANKFVGGIPSKPGDEIRVSDGGAYDNMGDQWDLGRSSRLQQWELKRNRPDGLGPTPNLLIVANASGAWKWQEWTATSKLGHEIVSLAKNQGVQYDQSTATRRRMLFNEFASAIRTGAGLRGVLIQIDRTPFQVIDKLPGPDEVGEEAHAAITARAAQARTVLGGTICTTADCQHLRDDKNCSARKRWQAIANYNTAIPTTLGPIGTEAYATLTVHARTATATYLYVLHNIGLVDNIEHPEATPQVSLIEEALT